MPASTPNFNWPYQLLTDPPNGATLGQSGFDAADASLAAEASTRAAADTALSNSITSLTGTVNAAGLGMMATPFEDTSGPNNPLTTEVKIGQITFTAVAGRRYLANACGALTNSGAGYASAFSLRWNASSNVTVANGTQFLVIQNSAIQFTQYVSGQRQLKTSGTGANVIGTGTISVGVFAVQQAAGSGGSCSWGNGAIQPTTLTVEDVGT
jgi:hypothetical protein